MADDIVTHLANLATDHGSYRTHYEGCHLYHLECAALIVCDEIERLRAQEQDLRMYAEQDACEIERLRSAGDALAEALHGWCNGMDAFTDDWERLRVWQQARCG